MKSPQRGVCVCVCDGRLVMTHKRRYHGTHTHRHTAPACQSIKCGVDCVSTNRFEVAMNDVLPSEEPEALD